MSNELTRRKVLAASPIAMIALAPAKAVSPGQLPQRSFKDAGAMGTGAADDGPMLRQVIAEASAQGEKIWLPKGEYRAGGTRGAVLTLTAPISVEGDGSAASVVNPAGASSTDDTIIVSPNTQFDHSGIKLSSFALHNPINGRRAGRHGIYLDTRAVGQFLPRLTLENLAIGEGAGWAILHDNDTAQNSNGGLYGATIRDNQLKGGLRLNNSGDSISIHDNIISGPRIGLDIALTPGASCLVVERCNITSTGGAIRHRSGSRPSYSGLNIENLAPGAAAENDGAVVNISGDRGVVVGGNLTDSLISAFGRSDASHLIKIANTRGFTLDRLTLLSGQVRRVVALEIAETAYDTKVGTLQMQIDGTGAFVMPIVDRGVGTMGVVKPATLLNGWKGAGPDEEPLQFLKSFDGVVRVWGTIARGDSSDGTGIAVLPERLRPTRTVHQSVMGTGSGGCIPGQISVAADGGITLAFLESAQVIRINCSFPAAALGHAISPE